MKPVSIPKPFTLPLDRERFEAAVRKGHGRALMHVSRYGASGVEHVIVDACVHNKAFDPQCETGRAEWMLQLCEAAGMSAQTVVAQLRVGLTRPADSGAFWDLTQLCEVAAILASRGDSDARRLVYDAFRGSEDSNDLIGCREIISIDGGDGLLFVVQTLGVRLAGDPDYRVDDMPIRYYDEEHGEGAAEHLLRSAADSDERVARYLRDLDASRHEHEGDTRDQSRHERMCSLSADDVIRDIERGAPGKGRYVYSGWGRRASDEDLRQVLDRAFGEPDAERPAHLLAVFQHRPLPEFDVRVLRFAEHSDRHVRWIAMYVLANHAHPDVRALALKRAKAGRHGERELRLFRNNYQSGDWSLIREALCWPDDEVELHWLLSDLHDIFEVNVVPELSEPMLLVYEHTPCTNCRRQAVNALLQAHQAPAWLLEECRFDADEQTRAAVADVT